jgi:acyl dehydratase
VTIVVDREISPPAAVSERYAQASGDHDPIHLDDAAAQAAGLPGRILHGLWTMAQLARVGQEVAGGDPWALQEISVQFRAPAYPGRTLAITGSATRSESATAVALEAVQDGRKVLASGRLTLAPQPGSP